MKRAPRRPIERQDDDSEVLVLHVLWCRAMRQVAAIRALGRTLRTKRQKAALAYFARIVEEEVRELEAAILATIPKTPRGMRVRDAVLTARDFTSD